MFALFWPFYGVIFVIYYSKGDTKLPSMSLFTITSKNFERNGLNFSLGLIKHKPWINSGDQLQLSSEVDNNFILDFDQLQRLQTTNLDYKSWVVSIIFDITVNDNIW